MKKHFLHCVCFISVFCGLQGIMAILPTDSRSLPITVECVLQIICYFIAVGMMYVKLPQVLGLIFFDCFTKSPILKADLKKLPKISFRTVTRGDYPDMIQENIQFNTEACKKVGLVNYVNEIVTEKRMSIEESAFVRQIVVPETYRTKNGTLFKARNLQYCLEDGISVLNDSDWIVHLDEDSILTVDAVIGIANFVQKGQHEFGQGAVILDRRHLSYLMKIFTGFRYINDYGLMRFQCYLYHRCYPLCNGSFVVCQVRAEKAVSFDRGPNSSVIEFVGFSLKSKELGYKFGRVEGYVREIGFTSVSQAIHLITRVTYGYLRYQRVSDLRLTSKIENFLVLLWFISVALCPPLCYYVAALEFDFNSLLLKMMYGIGLSIEIYQGIFYLFIHLNTSNRKFNADCVLLILISLIAGPFCNPIFMAIGISRAFFQKQMYFKSTNKEQ